MADFRSRETAIGNAAVALRRAEERKKLLNSRSFKEAARELDFVAVCLGGYTEPVPAKVGSNSTRNPVWVRQSRNPECAFEDFDRASALFPIVTLRYVWTPSDAHARRLKSALDARLIGNDPEMTMLRHHWRDVGDGDLDVVWHEVLKEAVADLQAGGETVEVFDEEFRVQRIIRHLSQRVDKGSQLKRG